MFTSIYLCIKRLFYAKWFEIGISMLLSNPNHSNLYLKYESFGINAIFNLQEVQNIIFESAKIIF